MDLHERLITARKHGGFATAVEAAESLGIPYGTYAGHENGSSGFRADKGAIYAKKFKVRFEWLMSGAGPMIDLASKYREVLMVYDSLPPDLQESYADVLRKLAAPYQQQAPDQESAPAKVKSSSE
jgi:hypothetical protein